MEMIISDRFVFPPVLEHDPLLLLGAQRRLEGTLLQFETLEVSMPILSARESQIERSPGSTDSLMILDLHGVARQPSSSLLNHFRAISVKYTLGNRLRQCRQCGFLTEMVSHDLGCSKETTKTCRFSSQNDTLGDQVWWIVDIVCEDFDTVQYLPVTSLCNLLLLLYIRQRSNHTNGTSTNTLSKEDDTLSKPIVHIGPKLLSKLHNLLHVSDTDNDQACSIIRFFVDKLADSDRMIRHVAASILTMLCQPWTDNDIKMKDESSSATDDINGKVFGSLSPEIADSALAFTWLPLLTKLACYDQISEAVALCFENLLAREASISSLTSCIQAMYDFWRNSAQDGVDTAENSSGMSLDQVSMLAHVFGKFLTKRRLIVNNLVSNDQIYGIFVDVFAVAVTEQVEVGMKQLPVTSIAEFKVVHVMDNNHKIQELKLPITTFHGIVILLSNWTRFLSHLDPSRRNGSQESTLQNLKLLKQALFPRSVASRGSSSSSNVVRSSTGLIATKDVKLCPEPLLMELLVSICIVKLNSSTDCFDDIDDLIHSVGKALSVKSLWSLLLCSYHPLTCRSMIFEKLHAKCVLNEEHAEHALEDGILESSVVLHTANKSPLRECAALVLDILLKSEHAFIGLDEEELKKNASYAFVKNWLHQKSTLNLVQSPSSALMFPSKKKIEPVSHLLDWEQIQTQAESRPSSVLKLESLQVSNISDVQTAAGSKSLTRLSLSRKVGDISLSKCLEEYLQRREQVNNLQANSSYDEQVALERFLTDISSNIQMKACSASGAEQLAIFLVDDVFLAALKDSTASNEAVFKRILQYVLCTIADTQSVVAIVSFLEKYIAGLEMKLGVIQDERNKLVADLLELTYKFIRRALLHLESPRWKALPLSSTTLKALSILMLLSRLLAIKHRKAQTLCERLLKGSEHMIFPILIQQCTISKCDSDSDVLSLVLQEIIHFTPHQWFTFGSTLATLVEEIRSEALMVSQCASTEL